MHPVIQSLMDFFKRRQERQAEASAAKVTRLAAIGIPTPGEIRQCELPIFHRRTIELQKRRVRQLRLRNARRFRLTSPDPTLVFLRARSEMFYASAPGSRAARRPDCIVYDELTAMP